MKRPGVSVIEVLIAIGMAAIVIAAIGNLIGATHRLTTASGKEIQATALARQWIEVIESQANQQFGCSCGIGFSCTRCPADINLEPHCTPRSSAGFNSCWYSAPLNLPFTFSGNGPWNMTDTSDGFTRQMSVENLQRDANGSLVASGGTTDTNTKKITVNVCWGDNDCTNPSNNRNRSQLTTILTAWKNF